MGSIPNDNKEQTKSKLPDGFKDDVPIQMHCSLQFKMRAFLNEKYGTQKYFPDCLALYVYLYQTARHQGNIRVWLNRSFIKKAMGWGQTKVYRTRDLLEEMGLIETMTSDDNKTKTGKIQGKIFLQVNLVWTPEKIELNEVEVGLKQAGSNLDEIIQNRTLKNLIINNLGYEIETDSAFTFYEILNGGVDLEAYVFRFEGENNKLIAHGGYEGEEDFAYTVPMDMLTEVLEHILGDKL